MSIMTTRLFRTTIGTTALLAWSVTAAGQMASLATAAAEQQADEVRSLLAAGADANTSLADGSTALLWAAHWNDLEMADQLLTADADVNAADDHGVTPLVRAAENASLLMVEKLLAAGANPNSSQVNGLTALMVASRTGHPEVVKAMLDAGSDVNASTNEHGATALMWATAEAHEDVVRMLIDRGAHANHSTTDGFTPLLFAAGSGNIQLAELLLASGVNVNDTGVDGTHALPYAIINGHHEFALFLLRQGADSTATLGTISALHAAAGNVGTWLGEWSRQHGFGERFRGKNLTGDQRVSLVQSLLEHGADPNVRLLTSAMFMSYIANPREGAFERFACGTGDLRGATPLWVAAHSANRDADGSIEILQLLLSAGANLHLTTDDGTTPLMAAAGLGRSTYTPAEPRGVKSETAEQAVALLIERGANVNAVNEADFTALHGAAFRGNNEIIEYLVTQGAEIDARDFRGRTPYRIAEGAKQSFQFQPWPETAAFLEELGANVHLSIPGIARQKLRDVSVEAADQ
jgi:ankyrin repeat protein